MADVLKTFREGEDILASETNDNNQYLLSKLTDNAAQIQSYVEGEISTIKSNVASVQATLQNNLDELTAQIKARAFKQKAKSVAVGTTNLTSYLPDDECQYQVWVQATTSASSTHVLSVKTDVMTTAREILRLDGDYGRSSSASILTTVPVGKGRSITFSGTANSITLCGYAKL